jgi:hypothetical protein
VPSEFFVVTPEAVVVPPWGPVTVPCSVAPVFVAVTLPVASTVCPFALVAVAVPFTVFPFCVTEVVAVPPRLVVTVFWAFAPEDNPQIKINVAMLPYAIVICLLLA